MESDFYVTVARATNSFNSLQTGRYMESETLEAIAVLVMLVSIPFKREGTWKVMKTNNLEHLAVIGFNSLQTGRYMES